MTKPKYMGGLGFRDIELFNLALLAKQAWRILQEPLSLSARVLKAVYFPDGDFLEAHIGTSPSRIWRAIDDGKDVLCQGLIRRIGTGEATDIWAMNWIPRDGLMRPISRLQGNNMRMVSDLIDNTTGCWDMQRLKQSFLPMDWEAIASIPLSTRRQVDFWAWHYEKTDVFTIRSAYRMLVSNREKRTDWIEHNPGRSDCSAERKEWTNIWQVQVPFKVRQFLWRLARQSIPTGDVRHQRHMAPDNRCVVCRGSTP